jgi:hypothetical protein
MPIVLDPDLPESLYPLAWLVGSWSGEGAAQVDDGSGDLDGRRIDQHVIATPRADGTLGWVMNTDLVDAPAPLPPTSVFFADANGGTGEQADGSDASEAVDSAPVEPVRELLVQEKGYWRVDAPLPGQDLEAAAKAAPGDPAGVISRRVELVIEREDGEEVWVGELRGPRIHLGLRFSPTARSSDGAIAATRMFGLWERALDPTDPHHLDSYLSVELSRG